MENQTNQPNQPNQSNQGNTNKSTDLPGTSRDPTGKVISDKGSKQGRDRQNEGSDRSGSGSDSGYRSPGTDSQNQRS